MSTYLRTGALWLLGLLAAGAVAADERELPPGYGSLGYELPAPGSYALPPMSEAADGWVLDSAGTRRRLHDLFDGRIVVLSFIYTHCSDVSGCPLSAAVLHQLRRRLSEDAELRGRVRLISLSFDPEHDTPEVMRGYATRLVGEQDTDWLFLTTASEAELRPILDAYGQSVQRELDQTGRPTGNFSHLLRVFLIDPRRRVRNIYSPSFLHADLVLNDIRNLLVDSEAGSVRSASEGRSSAGGGEARRGSGHPAAATPSATLSPPPARAADLLEWIRDPPLGLPPVPLPVDKPATPARVALGRKLFFDRRLSLNDTFSCAMCHIPEQGYTSNELATAVGIEGRTVRRNAPTLYNVAYARRLFHDGRESTLEQQVWGPLLARNEMGNPSIGSVIDKLAAMPDYAGQFELAFEGRGPTMETVGAAIASYERTLNSAASPFDRWYYGGEKDALGEQAARGFRLFEGKAGCSACHRVGPDHTLFTDDLLHNTGVGYAASMGVGLPRPEVVLGPGLRLELDAATLRSISEPPPSDLGLYELTQDPADRWKYKTPSLRNVALTSPYMHNGAFATLREVVEFYDRGGVPNELLDPLIHPLGLSDEEVDALVAFLESLTGANVGALVADALAAPVGDLTRSDPNWAHGSFAHGLGE